MSGHHDEGIRDTAGFSVVVIPVPLPTNSSLAGWIFQLKLPCKVETGCKAATVAWLANQQVGSISTSDTVTDIEAPHGLRQPPICEYAECGGRVGHFL